MNYRALPVLFVIGWLLGLIPCGKLWAQGTPTLNEPFCGTKDLTPAQAKALLQQSSLALNRKKAARKAFTDITYVPIRPHIVRRSDGTGGYPLANLNEAMASTNRYFLHNGFGIQFYFAGAVPDYIDDDALYQSFYEPPTGRDVNNALNQYYINQFAPGSNLAGGALFPGDYVESTRSVIQTYGNSSNGLTFHFGNRLIPHELGHNFGLLHTFGLSNGNEPTNELVTRGPGANCETAGDLICDTPADPYGIPGAATIPFGSCYQYDPNSTPRDANGEAYHPSISNLMSYWPSCTYDFTPGQYDRIQAGLALRQSHTSYSLTAPATNVSPPTNVKVRLLNGASSVELTWQDNATNEMGYFIERSISPTTGFVAVGGVAPDVISFTDTLLSPETRYYYRIRPSNTILGHLSSIISISTCPTPLYPTSSPARTSASLYWAGNTGQTNTIRYRTAGTTNWTTINAIPNGQFSSMYSLTGLNSSTAYEWQLQGVCSNTLGSEYTDIQSFTTLSCETPSQTYTSVIKSTSADISWYTATADPGRTAEVRYRVVGTPTWTTISNISSETVNAHTYTLTNLTNNTTYEWQLRHTCSATESSGYAPIATFTTSCRTPIGLTNNAITATRATLGWSLSAAPDIGTIYELRYRPVGSSGWSTVSNIVGGYSGIIYTLTGLAINTQYEWQVRTVCTANAQSDYSVTKQFTTVCNAPPTNGLTVALVSSTSVQLNWNGVNDPGTQYDIRYRPVGTADWLLASTTSVTGFGGTYIVRGLTNSITYEWQIRTVCSPTNLSTFIAGPSFTTKCQLPSYQSANPLVTSASLSWQSVGIDVTYDVRYRVAGTTNWSTLSPVTSSSANIIGLTGNTSYEWQLRTHCSDGIVTDFSAVSTFTTSLCSAPVSLQTTAIAINSAQLNWFFSYANTETRYEARYRVVGSANWNLLSNLTSINNSGTASLTTLLANTLYEWQIRTLCSLTESSDFSPSVTFQTQQVCPNMHTVKAGFWNDNAVWSCGRVPLSSDMVQLKHLVTIPTNYQAQVKQISYDAGQQLIFSSGSTLRFGQ
ncbi:hypothetical protein GO755_10645 [Spirosoma sp. HMF4905]|uniref:Fibronectin type-III domain-containing protein n=1 Tax=Spirosoma arboris TaxID=2682092 RepID=A0A7K1S9H4_9BACT|nr:fibronectin type III domain-containing protein [Spirosoma arboris]MVM30492.1 hypothetical protein [Spirosoma arboris]